TAGICLIRVLQLLFLLALLTTAVCFALNYTMAPHAEMARKLFFAEDRNASGGEGQIFRNFFFSSRRRHTRSYGDWSSDRVLFRSIHRILLKVIAFQKILRIMRADPIDGLADRIGRAAVARERICALLRRHRGNRDDSFCQTRSEERRVGKEL